MYRILLVFMSIVLSAYSVAFGANFSYANQNTEDNYLKGQFIFVPQGVTASVLLSTPLNSQTTKLGTPVSAIFTKPFSYNGKIIAPTGSTLSGTVVRVKPAGRFNRDGEIMVRFNSITSPQNFDIAISAVIQTDDNKGILKGGTKIKPVNDPTVDVRIAEGLSVLKGTDNMGESVEVPSNSIIQVYFDQPITSSAPIKSY